MFSQEATFNAEVELEKTAIPLKADTKNVIKMRMQKLIHTNVSMNYFTSHEDSLPFSSKEYAHIMSANGV